mgnify:CR=1 FL=1
MRNNSNGNNNNNEDVENTILSSNFRSFGWVLIYVFAFGVNKMLVGKYIKSELSYILYYLTVGIIGYLIISHNGYY